MKFKKGTSLFLALVMVLGTFTMSAYALDDSESVNEEPQVVEQEESAPIEATAAEEEGEAVDVETEEAPVVVNATKVENVVYSDITDSSVTVAKSAALPEMEAIEFVSVANADDKVSVEVADGLETPVVVEGIKANTLYSVSAVKGEESTVIGYYVNAKFAATKDGDELVASWDCGTAEGLEVALTKDGAAVAVDGSKYVDTDVAPGSAHEYALTVSVTDGEAIYEAYAATKSVTIPELPVAVTDLKGKGYKATQYSGTGDSKVISADSVRLTWTPVEGASSYDVYYYDVKAAKWTKAGNTTSGTYTVAKLKNGRSYKFKVKSVIDNGVAKSYKDSNVTGSFAISYQTAKTHAIYYKGVITAKAKGFKTSKTKKVSKTLKKGTKVTVLQRAGGRSQVMLSNGKIYWVNRTKCHYTKQIYNSKKDWSTSAKESFVKNKSSKTKYLIWISQYTQRVNVFKGKKGSWKLIKTGLCATGRITRKTPMGTFKTTYKEKGWFYKKYKNAPVVHFAGRNSFHSRPTSYSGKVITKTIGKPASKGCCRLEQAYVDWIYKYIPKGTAVISW